MLESLAMEFAAACHRTGEPKWRGGFDGGSTANGWVRRSPAPVREQAIEADIITALGDSQAPSMGFVVRHEVHTAVRRRSEDVDQALKRRV